MLLFAFGHLSRLNSMYVQCNSRVETQRTESDPFEIASEVRQGVLIPLLLFIIFMHICLRNMGTRYYEEETLMYTDDVEVLDNSAEDI